MKIIIAADEKKLSQAKMKRTALNHYLIPLIGSFDKMLLWKRKLYSFVEWEFLCFKDESVAVENDEVNKKSYIRPPI